MLCTSPPSISASLLFSESLHRMRVPKLLAGSTRCLGVPQFALRGPWRRIVDADLSAHVALFSAPRWRHLGIRHGESCKGLGLALLRGRSSRSRGICGSSTGDSLDATVSSGSSSSGRGRGIAETDMLAAGLRERVVGAVERLGGRVTVGDASSAAGVSLLDAQRALTALAADTNACLEVSDEGDVVYVFGSSLRSALAQRSLRVRLDPLLNKAKEVLSYLARVSFGTALIVSVAVVYSAIFVLLSSRSDSDNRNERGGGYRSRYSGPALYFDVSDLLWYWDPFYYRSLRRRLEKREMSFLESVFSFVFGDGDPNEGIDEVRWQTVGDVISRRGGVVAAQEVAPYLDVPTDSSDESYMIPVLQKFDGIPSVDDQGNILYRFPSLQRTAQDWLGRPKVVMDSDAPGARRSTTPSIDYLMQKPWPFSVAPRYKQLLAAGLGLVNVVGILILSSLLRDPVLVRQAGSELVNGVASVLPFLTVYAGAFFAVPAVRWAWLQRVNERIEEANMRREESAMALARPSAPLRRKLANAREQAERTVLSEDRVLYSTGKDMGEQDLESRLWEQKLQDKA